MNGNQGKKEAGTPDRTPEMWTYSDNPILRRLLDHLAEQIATKWIRRLKGAGSPEAQGPGEKGDRT